MSDIPVTLVMGRIGQNFRIMDEPVSLVTGNQQKHSIGWLSNEFNADLSKETVCGVCGQSYGTNFGCRGLG